MLEEQDWVCPLCEEIIDPDEATLDHCYDSGRVRAVLHRSCNGQEGRVKTAAGRMSRGTDPMLWIKNLVKYWETSWEHNPLHPKHGKPVTKKRRRRNVQRLKKPRK